MCSLGSFFLPSENCITESLLSGNPTDARHQFWLQTPVLCGGGYHPRLQAGISPKLAGGKLLVIAIERKQTDPDENVVAEYGSPDAFTHYCYVLPILVWLALFAKCWFGIFSLYSFTGFCLILRFRSSL